MRTLKAPKTALQVVIADCRKVGISTGAIRGIKESLTAKKQQEKIS